MTNSYERTEENRNCNLGSISTEKMVVEKQCVVTEEMLADIYDEIISEDKEDALEDTTCATVLYYLIRDGFKFDFSYEGEGSEDTGKFNIHGCKNIEMDIENGTEVTMKWHSGLIDDKEVVEFLKDMIVYNTIQLDTKPRMFLKKLGEIEHHVLCVEKNVTSVEAGDIFGSSVSFNLIYFYSDINRLWSEIEKVTKNKNVE